MKASEKAALVRRFLAGYAALANPACSEAEWVALKLGCSLSEARRLVVQVRGEEAGV